MNFFGNIESQEMYNKTHSKHQDIYINRSHRDYFTFLLLIIVICGHSAQWISGTGFHAMCQTLVDFGANYYIKK